MSARVKLALLVGTLVIFVSSARATAIRVGTPYGVPPAADTIAVGSEWIVLNPPGPSGSADLLLQISPTSPDLGDPINVTLDLATATFDSTTGDYAGTSTSDGTFGIIECTGSTYAGGNLNAICTPTTNAACDLSGITDSGGVGTITIPGACDVANETFYFDLYYSARIQESDAANISISAVTATTTPEPSPLALLVLALIPLALLSRRRLRARA